MTNTNTTPNIWHFDSTVEAYDACQCREDIKTGDILVIENEQVIGLADCWPVALTKERGELHQIKPDWPVAGWCQRNNVDFSVLDIVGAMITKMGFGFAHSEKETISETAQRWHDHVVKKYA